MTATDSGDDVCVKRCDGILEVTLNRPERRNALTFDTFSKAADVVAGAEFDSDVRVVMFTGAGSVFCAGADLAGRADNGTRQRPVAAVVAAANRLTNAIRYLPKPVLAAVNGPAFGVGCAFAFAADLTFAKESAYFQLSFVTIGMMPDGGITALLPAAIGRARAMRMAILGERLGAIEAANCGLIAGALPDEGFDAEVQLLAERLANGPTAAYAWTKRAIDDATIGGLSRALELERLGQQTLSATADVREGLAAFREKRPPQFTGR